jgi:hypothetical protein
MIQMEMQFHVYQIFNSDSHPMAVGVIWIDVTIMIDERR